MTSYVGFDVSLGETSVCVLDAGGKVRFEGKVKSRPEDLIACVREHADDAERIGLETGQTAALLFRVMEAAGLPVVCLETRHAHKALSARSNKTDRNNARNLAELIRVGWYREAWVRGAPAHAIRSLLLGRRMLLATRRTLENTLRGAVKRFGLIITKTAGRTFKHRAAAAMELDPAYAAFAMPIFAVLQTVVDQIASYNRQLRAAARDNQTVSRLMTVLGIGHLTALAYYSTIEDPSRFKRSEDVGAYLGLTPRVYQSGEMDRTGRITKSSELAHQMEEQLTAGAGERQIWRAGQDRTGALQPRPDRRGRAQGVSRDRPTPSTSRRRSSSGTTCRSACHSAASRD